MKKGLTVNTLALGNLKSRKRQYASLITGIILAIVFSSFVLLMFSSMNASIDKMEKDLCGKQDGIYIGATQQMLNDAADKQLIGSYGYAHVVGQAFTDNGDSFAVASYDDKAAELANIQFIDGSYPQNEEEIAVESATLAQLGIDASVGDRVTLNFAVQNGENHLPQVNRKTFILSGIAENKLSNIKLCYSGYENSIPTVFVAKGVQTEPGGKEMLVCYFDFYGTGAFSDEKYYDDFRAFLENEGYGTSKWIHTAIAASYFNNNTINESGTYIVFLTVILLVASCLGIVNAFSSNLNERRQQIGMLRTVGATKRQIIIIFGREAFIICVICIPAGIAISCLLVKCITFILGKNFIFTINIWIMIISAFISVVCVMLASLIPLIKAANVTPLQTVRNINMTGKAARKKMKSKHSFVPSELIAKRNLFFHGKARAAASIILVITILGSCYGFSAVNAIYDDGRIPRYDFEMTAYPLSSDFINLPQSDTFSFSYSDYSEIKSIPYVGQVNVSQYCEALIPCGEFTEYQKTVLYSNHFVSAFDPSKFEVSKLTEENIDDTLLSSFSLAYSAVRDYASKNVLPVKIAALESNVIKELSDSIDSGKMDITQLNAGREVIVFAPREIALEVVMNGEDDSSGYMWNADINEQVKNSKGYLKRAKCDFEPGQKIGLSVITGNPPSSDNGGESYSGISSKIYLDTGKWEKTDKEVKIGALISELPKEFFNESAAFSTGNIIILTTVDGMKNIYNSSYYSNINFNLDTECTDQKDAEITEQLQNITDRLGNNMSFLSYYNYTKSSGQQNTALLVSLSAAIILFLSISASIINNSLTAQIHEGRREIGTLRAVGASVRELFGSYIRQLLSLLGISYTVGFGLFIISYLIIYAVEVSNEYYERIFKFNIWQTVLACTLLFLFCGTNLWLKVRKEMKHSVIDNIREL